MRYKIILLLTGIVLLIFRQTATAQTTLPASWDCTNGTLPAAWSTSITGYYTSSAYVHSLPSSCKFDADGIYLEVFFADEPDTLEYYLRGSSFSGGTYNVQESDNGSTWTNIRTFNDANIPNSSLSSASPFIEILNSNSRYVRFVYTNKSAGNVALDDIRITKKPLGPEAEISVKVNDILIQTGQLAVTGNALAVPCKVFNSGTDSVLRITSYTITGTNAAMFSVSGMPLTVASQDSAGFTLNFSPSGADGQKTATLNIYNNDISENPYVINIWAVKGCCAAEPLNPATNLSLSDVKSYKFRIGFANGATIPDNYLVLKKDAPITEEPADGQHYIKGDYIGNAQVVYIGPPAFFYPLNVVANTTYYVKVFPFNGYPGYENYLTVNPAQGSIATLHDMIGNYYSSINPSSPAFRQDLHNLINNHLPLLYGDFGTTVVANVASRDTSENGYTRKVISCAYSGEPYVYADPFAWNYFSREHNFCRSWMPTYNDTNFTDLPEYSDYHNLMPVNQNKVNTYRNNYPMGEVDTAVYQFHGFRMGDDSLGNKVVEPRDEIKGDCARAMMYMVLCYDGISGNHWFLPDTISPSILYGQDPAVLKKWHHQDPVSNYEMAKNDYIYSIQGNRNPFIDSVDWVDQLDFSVFGAIKENMHGDAMEVYPNPCTGTFYIKSDAAASSKASISIYNIAGELVLSRVCRIDQNAPLQVETNLYPGFYIMDVNTNSWGRVHKLIIR